MEATVSHQDTKISRSISAKSSRVRREHRVPVPKNVLPTCFREEESHIDPANENDTLQTGTCGSLHTVASTVPTRSSYNVAKRVRIAELEADEQIIALKIREVKLEEELIRKRLALKVARIYYETDQEDRAEAKVEPVGDCCDSCLKRKAVQASSPPKESLIHLTDTSESRIEATQDDVITKELQTKMKALDGDSFEQILKAMILDL